MCGALSYGGLGHAKVQLKLSIWGRNARDSNDNGDTRKRLRPQAGEREWHGSASANGLLMQAIFRMGIPVSGKNLFPSNIRACHLVRDSRQQETATPRGRLEYDLMVAMNVADLRPGRSEVGPGRLSALRLYWPLDSSCSREDVQPSSASLWYDVHRALPGVARTNADEERRLCRRAR